MSVSAKQLLVPWRYLNAGYYESEPKYYDIVMHLASKILAKTSLSAWQSHHILLFYNSSPRGITFSWWGCYGLCHRHKLTKLAHSFLFCSCVCFCLYGPFNSISFHKFSRQLFAFSLCSSGLNSALLILSNYVFLYESVPQSWCNLLWLTGLKAPNN